MNQPKLQQLHARLEAHVTEHDDNGMVTKRDLRDLVACLIEEESDESGECNCVSGRFESPLCPVHHDPKPAKAADVNASPPGAPTDVDASLRAPAFTQYQHEIITDKNAEIARLRAEAKPEPAGREWVLYDEEDKTFAAIGDWVKGRQFAHRFTLAEAQKELANGEYIHSVRIVHTSEQKP